jgi:hypothetical protein
MVENDGGFIQKLLSFFLYHKARSSLRCARVRALAQDDCHYALLGRGMEDLIT